MKPYGVIYLEPLKPTIVENKRDFISWVEFQTKSMDICGVHGGFRLWKPLSLFGLWTQWQTDAAISHVQLIGPGKTVFTTDFKYKQIPIREALQNEKRILIKRMGWLDSNQTIKGLAACKTEIGKRYPYLDPVSMKIQSIFNPGAYKLKVDSKEHICSQSVGWVYNQMGEQLAPGSAKHWSKLTPIDCLSDDRMSVISYWGYNLPKNVFLR